MFDVMMAAGFQHVDETDQIGIDVGVRILERVADAGLRRQIDDALRAVPGEGFGQRRPVLQAGPYLGEARTAFSGGPAAPASDSRRNNRSDCRGR